MCQHNEGFKFLPCVCADRLPGVWVCVACEQYSLNFNPENFRFGIAYVDRQKKDESRRE